MINEKEAGGYLHRRGIIGNIPLKTVQALLSEEEYARIEDAQRNRDLSAVVNELLAELETHAEADDGPR